MKVILPWILVVGLAIGVFALFSSNQKQAAELAQIHQQSEEAQKAQAPAETKSEPVATEEELTQLRKDHEDVLRLRNEVRQLRDEKQQLARQAQAAQNAAANSQQQEQLQKLTAENQQLKIQSQVTQQRDQMAACINYLRQIDGAKEQWALENQKPAGTLVSTQDLAPYFPNKTVPTCPANGVYTLNPVGLHPICNIVGHVLPK
jgi:membrane-associated HD superfamily phosphohydrolase